MAINDSGSFLDNPLIKAIGSQLGLDNLFSAAGANPAPAKGVSAVTPAPARPAASRPNVAESRDLPGAQLRLMRLMQAQNRQTTSGGAGMGMPGSMETPLMDPEVLQDPHVQQMLQSYGVNPNVQVDPHLFIHNPEAWAKHPVLSGMLENALSGAAFTRGSETTGQGISNVVQGMMANQSAHAQRINAQLMMPFQQAGVVDQLRAMQQNKELRDAQITEDKARAGYWDKMGNFKDNQPTNPIWALQQQLMDASAKGDTETYQRLMRVYQGLEGQLHPQRQLPQPQGLNAARTDAWHKLLNGMLQQYSPENHDPNDIPESVYWPTYIQFMSGEKATKYPPKSSSGNANPVSELLRKSMIDDASKLIDVFNAGLRQSGDYYVYQGAQSIPGVPRGRRMSAQDVANYKNKLVTALNTKLALKKLAPLPEDMYTAAGSAPKWNLPTAPVPSTTPAATEHVPTYDPNTGTIK